jgi:hypothetical protein
MARTVKPNSVRTGKGGPLALATTPGGQYGSGKASMDAQRAVPMGSPPVPPAVGPPGGGQGPSGVSPAPLGPPPGTLTPLDAPTQRPDEPVTAGAAQGPGPGPDRAAFDAGRKAQLAALNKYLPAWEKAANTSEASPDFRALVQYLKAQR